ncbi:hypothetical protein [Streptomyces sp. 891-h]|uniref:hypothetical protein n=1 Tax=unclassified Streptomyces TaxID=2593676 RepID=UPI001FAADDA4|nr:hypothetical protein [Streptomyces sp. 891-h]UNZ20318.1 hypothetical protein HC362_27920 [Streptomyces sp. 891-h]
MTEGAEGRELLDELGLADSSLADSSLAAEEPFRSFLAGLGPGVVPEMERYGAELAARHNGLADDALCTLALAVLDGCGPPEGRSGLRADLASRAAAGSGQESGEAAERRAAVWRALGDLLAREEGAPGDGPEPFSRLARAMADGRRTPESERFELLRALHRAALARSQQT